MGLPSRATFAWALIAAAAVPAARAQITETQVTSATTDQRPAWSPDGTTILFDSDRSGNKDVWSVPAAGGAATRLTANTLVDQHPDWAPGSATFVYSANAGAGTDLYVRSISGGPSTLLDADSTAADLFPAWSPDSLLIAYEKGGDIYVIASAGGIPTQLTTDPARDSHPSWSPDGTQIVFRTDREGNNDLWIVPAGGGGLTQLTTDGTSDTGPDWSPTGDLIVFSSNRSGQRDLWMMPAGGGTATRLTTSAFDEGEPDWGPSGQDIVFTRFGGQGLYRISFPLVDVAVTNTVDVSAPPELSTVTYTVTVSNAGPDPASGVQVTDALPAGVTLQGFTSTAGTFDSGTGLWDVDSVAVSVTDTLTLTATVDSATAGQTLTSTATLTALFEVDGHKANHTASIGIGPTGVDLGITKGVDDPTPMEGATVSFVVTLANTGTDPGTGVDVTDALPAGLTFQSSSVTRGTYTSGTGLWQVDSVLAGIVDTLTVTATVDSGTTGMTLTNTASVTALDQPDTNPGNDSDGVDVVPGAVDLALTQIVNNPAPDVGDTTSFTVTLANQGAMTATGIEVTDFLPAGITYVIASPTGGAYDDSTGVWSVASLAVSSSVNLSLNGTVDGGTAGQTLTNTAVVTASDQTDPVAANDTSSVSVTVTSADIAVTKTVDNLTPAEGAALRYEIVATNLGPDDVTSMEVTDLLPAGVTFGSAVPTEGSYTSSTGIWSVSSIAAGVSDTLIINATVDAGTAGQIIPNTAFLSGTDQAEINAANDTSAVSVLVGAVDLSLAMKVSNGVPNGGETISYEIVVSNGGPNPVSNLVVTDVLPPELLYVSDTPTQGTYTPGTGEWSVPAMTTGTSDTLTLSATVTGTAPGASISNSAAVTALDQLDTSVGNDSRTILVTVGAMVTEQQLTSAATDRRPAYSPDGSTVLFDSDRSGNKDIWSIPLPIGIGNATRITGNALVDQHADWAPGGAMFVYSANAGAGTDLYLRPASGGSAILLDADPNAPDTYPSWSPDSLQIAYDKGGDIYVIPSSGGTPAQLTSDPSTDSHPSWSPDGTRIAFRSDRSGNPDIWILPSTGGTAVQLTTNPASDIGPDWSPGNLVAFSSDRNGNRDIFVLPADGGGAPVQMTTSNFDDIQPDWAPTGDQLAITRLSAQGIYLLSFPVADVRISKSVDTPSTTEGATVTFTVAAFNAGPDPATGVEVTDLLPAGVTFQSASATSGTYSSVTGLWTLGTLGLGVKDTLTVTATVDSGTTGMSFTNIARVTELAQLDADTSNDVDSTVVNVPGGAVPVPVPGIAPAVFALGPARPTPFRDVTSIRFDVPVRSRAELVVYDVSGRRVRTLAHDEMDAGSYTVRWDGRDARGRRAAAGVYFVRLKAGDFTAVRKAVRLR